MSASGCGADEGEHELARSGLTIAPRLGECVFRCAGDGEGLDEARIERIRRRFPRAQAIDRGREIGLRQIPCPQQRRLRRPAPVGPATSIRQHLARSRFGQRGACAAVGRAPRTACTARPRRAWPGPPASAAVADRSTACRRKAWRTHVGDHQAVGDLPAERHRLRPRAAMKIGMSARRPVIQLDPVRVEHFSDGRSPLRRAAARARS